MNNQIIEWRAPESRIPATVAMLPVVAKEAKRHSLVLAAIFAGIALLVLAMGLSRPKSYTSSTMLLVEEANIIEPGSAPSLNGLLLYYKRDYEAAENAIRTAMNDHPDVASVHIILGRIFEARGRFTEALEELRIASQLSAGGGGVPLRVGIVCLEAITGQRRDADRVIRELERHVSNGGLQLRPRDMAYIRLACGDREGALRAFALAIDERDPSLVWLGVDPRVDSLRPDARFAAMLKQLGLS